MLLLRKPVSLPQYHITCGKHKHDGQTNLKLICQSLYACIKPSNIITHEQYSLPHQWLPALTSVHALVVAVAACSLC
jgi:hypothetical protein